MANLNQTQTRYYYEPYRSEFTATIIESSPLPDGRYSVTLDQTYFYPTGGGQEHDMGTISNSRVIDVVREENTLVVRHIVQDNLPIGPALCKIDWEHRLRNMQHHTGQHLLSQCIIRLHEYPTTSANINGYTPSTLDIAADRLLTDDELDKIEDLANKIIYENRTTSTYFVDSENLAKIPLRRQPKVSENIRIVEIDGYDYSACGGTHCTHTGEIGTLKILKNERINNKTRIHFVTGLQATHVFRNYHNTIRSLATYLSVNTEYLSKAVFSLGENAKNMQKQIQALRYESLVHEAQSLIGRADVFNENRFVCSTFENRPTNELRTLADVLKANNQVLALLASYDGNRLSVIVACGANINADAKEILQQILSLFDGKGGGDRQIAQGGGIAKREDIDVLLSNGRQIVRKLIS